MRNTGRIQLHFETERHDAMFEDLLRRLGIGETNSGVYCGDGVESDGGAAIQSTNPATGQPLPAVRMASVADYERVVTRANQAFQSWHIIPPPRRGEVVRQIGLALRAERPISVSWSPLRPVRSGPKARVRSRK